MSVSEAVVENSFQEQFGLPSEGARTKVRGQLTEYDQDYIRHSPFAVLATSNKDGKTDASPRGGIAGFVGVLDENHLLLPDVAGNRLFHSYGNIEENPNVGLIFFIPGLEDTVRVNGAAEVVSKEHLEERKLTLSVHQPDDNAKHIQGLLIKVEEAYNHCPRALKFGALWDTETIQNNQETRPIANRQDRR